MRRLAILALLAFLAGGSQALSAPGRAEAPQATFGATADAYVSSAARRGNFGRARTLRVSSRPVMRTYLRFQVKGLAAPVARATLRIHSKTRGRGFQVRATGGSWAERRLTFRNGPRPGRVVGSIGRLRRSWIDRGRHPRRERERDLQFRSHRPRGDADEPRGRTPSAADRRDRAAAADTDCGRRHRRRHDRRRSDSGAGGHDSRDGRRAR